MIPALIFLAFDDASMMSIVDSVAAAASDSAAATWKYSGWDAVIAGDGFTIAMVGIVIVFLSLTTISLLIRALKKYASGKPKAVVASGEDASVKPRNGISGEVVAAISIALQSHLFELHDEERTILTINKVSKPYSPWSSKLYTMTPSPTHTILKR
jgi:glutaconyl-CoA/methylmalonyl-CoA decarboxylase subunit delta